VTIGLVKEIAIEALLPWPPPRDDNQDTTPRMAARRRKAESLERGAITDTVRAFEKALGSGEPAVVRARFYRTDSVLLHRSSSGHKAKPKK
jgi:hypothetical protein